MDVHYSVSFFHEAIFEELYYSVWPLIYYILVRKRYLVDITYTCFNDIHRNKTSLLFIIITIN